MRSMLFTNTIKLASSIDITFTKSDVPLPEALQGSLFVTEACKEARWIGLTLSFPNWCVGPWQLKRLRRYEPRSGGHFFESSKTFVANFRRLPGFITPSVFVTETCNRPRWKEDIKSFQKSPHKLRQAPWLRRYKPLSRSHEFESWRKLHKSGKTFKYKQVETEAAFQGLVTRR